MRKVSEESIQSFINGINFSNGNTTVSVIESECRLLLHGNMIAVKKGNSISITNCGYFTNVTKERLNAIPNVHIVQKQKKWFLNGSEWDGKLTEVK